MNYNNNNLNPTTGYWNLSNANPTPATDYAQSFGDLSYCNTVFLTPIINQKQQIDAKFTNLNGKITDFGTFINQFSANPKFAGFSLSDPKQFCDTVLINDNNEKDPSYNDCKTKANDIKTMVTDISNNISAQSSKFTALKNDRGCRNTNYDDLQKQYQSMVQRRQEIDTIMNEYNKKNANSLTQAHLQETDMLLYTSVLWIVLGTSALYFSFRYLND